MVIQLVKISLSFMEPMCWSLSALKVCLSTLFWVKFSPVFIHLHLQVCLFPSDSPISVLNTCLSSCFHHVSHLPSSYISSLDLWWNFREWVYTAIQEEMLYEYGSSVVWFLSYGLLKIKADTECPAWASVPDVAHLNSNCLTCWKIPVGIPIISYLLWIHCC
jgi:hypothetical protein